MNQNVQASHLGCSAPLNTNQYKKTFIYTHYILNRDWKAYIPVQFHRE